MGVVGVGSSAPAGSAWAGPALLLSLVLLLLSTSTSTSTSTTDVESDVVVYGGTSCGVAAAIGALQANPSAVVTLLVNGSHLGGMTTGGLSSTDLRDPRILGGMAAAFYGRMGKQLESHRAEALLKAMLLNFSHPPTVVYNTLGCAKVSVEHRPGQAPSIAAITTNAGQTYAGRTFIDCSYEGDLVIQSGVSYAVGREANTTYNETMGGVQGWPYPNSDLGQQFPMWENFSISPYDDKGALLPGIQPGNPRPGTADAKVMSYNFRLCITANDSNRVPFAKPAGYTAEEFAVLTRYLGIDPGLHQLDASMCPGRHRQPGCGMFIISHLPNDKIDLNCLGPFSTDVLGPQWGYPLGNVSTRNRIFDQHKVFTQKVLWYMANEKGLVPAQMFDQFRQYGLCRDEFVDSGNWPPQLYVRESVRLMGAYVMTQHDVTLGGQIRKPTSVGLSDWEVDSHHVQRIVVTDPATGQPRVMDEGEVEGNRQHTTSTYEVPFEALLPKAVEGRNLLVPVCASMSHVAFATYRLEPQYFIFGQSAGVAAAMAARRGLAVHDLNITALQAELIRQGQVLHLPPTPPPPPQMRALVTRPCQGGRESQSWSLGPSTHLLVNEESNECASVLGYSTSDNAKIVAAGCHPQDRLPTHQNQEFVSDGSHLIGTQSKKCLAATDTNEVVLAPCTAARTRWQTAGAMFQLNGTTLCLDTAAGPDATTAATAREPQGTAVTRNCTGDDEQPGDTCLHVSVGSYDFLVAKGPAWTLRAANYSTMQWIQPTGWMQTVVNMHSPNGTMYWCGTGHGKEVVQSVVLYVDGRAHNLSSGVTQPVTGSRFTVSKRSTLCRFSSQQNVTFDATGMAQSFAYTAIANTSDVNFMYPFMTIFSDNATHWEATCANGSTVSGQFRRDNSFSLHADILNASVFDPVHAIGSHYRYPVAYRSRGDGGNFFWNRPFDNKLYFQVTVPSRVGTTFGYQLHVSAFPWSATQTARTSVRTGSSREPWPPRPASQLQWAEPGSGATDSVTPAL